MHIEQVIARERQARQRRYALEDAARDALSQTLAARLGDGVGRHGTKWTDAVDDSLRRFGREATGRALLSLGRAVRFREARA
jgi:hypothetical protein